jgi:hemin uptake protein HemP
MTHADRPRHVGPGQLGGDVAHASTAALTLSLSPRAKDAEGHRKVVQLSTLLGSSQCVDIAHSGHIYRLQITKAGKLILTK